MPARPNFAANEPARTELGQRLKRARKQSGITLKAAAADTNHVHGWLVEIEAGRRGIDAFDLAALAQLYGYPVDFFLSATFDPAARFRPRTRADFISMYGDDDGPTPGLADLLFSAYQWYEKNRAIQSTPELTRERNGTTG